MVEKEFNEIWVVDLGGDVRSNKKLSGTTHNVFGIQAGVAISFMVKRTKASGCRISYSRRPELETAYEKLAFLGSAKLSSIPVEELHPDTKWNWTNQTTNDFDTLVPLVAKATKLADKPTAERAIFRLYSLGIVTNRDEWTYDYDRGSLGEKIRLFCRVYESEAQRWRDGGRPQATAEFVSRSIKWTSEREGHLKRGTPLVFEPNRIVRSLYRPYVHRWTYLAPVITHRPYQNFSFFPTGQDNNVGFSFGVEARAEFGVIATDRIANKDMFIPSAAQCVFRWCYSDDGRRIDNITDWGFEQFRKHYQPGRGKKDRPITKDGIFEYVYGVLHDPLYRAMR